MAGEQAVKKSFAKLRALAGSTAVVVFYGSATPYQEKLLRSVAKKNDFQLVALGPFVQQYLEDHNLPTSPEERKKLLTVAPNDRHPSALGHEIISEALLGQLSVMID